MPAIKQYYGPLYLWQRDRRKRGKRRYDRSTIASAYKDTPRVFISLHDAGRKFVSVTLDDL